MSEENVKEYYLVKFKILQEEYYTIWHTDHVNQFLMNRDRTLTSFPTKEEAEAFAKEEGFVFNAEEPEFFISPTIIERIKTGEIDCRIFLEYWRVLSDAAYSVAYPFYGDHRGKRIIQRTYEKLCKGSNTSEKEGEKPYIPKWSWREKYYITKVMKNGFDILSEGLNTSWNV